MHVRDTWTLSNEAHFFWPRLVHVTFHGVKQQYSSWRAMFWRCLHGLGVINAFNLSQTEENGTSHLSTAFTLKVKTIAIMEKLYSLLLNTCTCIFCFNAFLKNKHRENFKLILYRKVIFTFLFKNDPMNIWSGNRRLYFVFASCKSSLLAHHPNHSYNHL